MLSVIRDFTDSGTEDVFNGRNTKAARSVCPRELWRVAQRKLDQLDSVEELDELRVPPGNRLEALGADRKGQHSIRVNEQYRICFKWSGQGPRAVGIVDYH
jgi:proteic killer suppression protein